MSSSHSESCNNPDKNTWIPLLKLFYGEYHSPVIWDHGKKSKNYFALISPGTKYPFARKFLQNLVLDKQIVYKESDFPDEAIVEQKSVFIRGSKEETIFHGFFIIHHTSDAIMGEEISQKEALQYFDCKKALPDVEHPDDSLNKLRVKLGTVVRKFTVKYGEEAIVEILTDILEEYFPK